MPYTTRPAVLDDADVIARYNQAMAAETEDKPLSLETLIAGVRRVFDEPSHGRYLVAEDDESGAVVGCLLITYEWSDWRDGQVWWVQSVYVDPDHRRRGVFKRLYAEVRRLGDAAGGVCGYRLYVERDNRRAQQTYQQLGMSPTPYVIFEDMRD
jgi:GNAT superfamily N-acetyltransferase